MATKKKFIVKLRAHGNPDHRQYADVARPKDVPVASLEDASKTCRAYIEKHELWMGNWVGEAGIVMENGEQVARIGYNGKIFQPDYPPLPRIRGRNTGSRPA